MTSARIKEALKKKEKASGDNNWSVPLSIS
jgi:hypothetical protein